MKGFPTHLRVPELEPHYQMQFVALLRNPYLIFLEEIPTSVEDTVYSKFHRQGYILTGSNQFNTQSVDGLQ